MTKYVAENRPYTNGTWIYHTDPECSLLKGNDVRELTPNEERTKDIQICKQCSGETYRDNKPNMKYYNAAVNND